MATLNIRISDYIAGRLDLLAAQTGRTKSYYVREALEDKLRELEDYYLSIQVAEKVANGNMRVWSQQDIEQQCDLDQ